MFIGDMNAHAGWEMGSGIGFDSNIDRSVNGGEGDTYLTAYISLIREPSYESRLDWYGAVSLEAAAYADNSDLNYGMIDISPGLIYFPHALWSIEMSPFFEASVVNDSDQSARALGAQINLNQQIREGLYTGQYYVYRDSRADVETYSFTEHVIGVFLGVDWTKTFFSEVGYEYARGDSFRTITTTSIVLSGRGRNRTYSQAFGAEVISEDVDQNAVGFTAGYEWDKSLFSYVGYTFSTIKGDLGSSDSHAGILGIGHRF